MHNSRENILARLREQVKKGKPIVGAGAGTGISAKCEEAGGVDLIVIYNSGRYRMAGRGSLAGVLAYGNANEIVKEMAREVLTVVRHTPVLAGVCGTDPFMLRDHFLRELRDMGFAGIQNFPTVGLIDGLFRQNLEETGMSYALEVECIAAAHELNMLTTPYAFNTREAEWMTKAGADIVVAHMGFNDQRRDRCSDRQDARSVHQRSAGHHRCVQDHSPRCARALPRRADCHARRCSDHVPQLSEPGWLLYGASSMERLPTEIAITNEIKKFTSLSLK